MQILVTQINDLKRRIKEDLNPAEESAELSKLTTENVKLKHRLAILNRVSCGYFKESIIIIIIISQTTV